MRRAEALAFPALSGAGYANASLEGRAALEDAASEVKATLRRYRKDFYRNLSLNVPAYEGGPDRIDLLRAEEHEGEKA